MQAQLCANAARLPTGQASMQGVIEIRVVSMEHPPRFLEV
jgi:hypothetical protein